MTPEALALARPRWDGRPGRVETWYVTFTDHATGDGYWIHAETHAPLEGQPTAHGWFAAFPREGDPFVERFGPDPADGPAPAPTWFRAAGCVVGPGVLTGRAGELAWDLTYEERGAALCTFPRWAFERDVLPGAQVVPAPAARFRGTLRLRGGAVALTDATGAVAHIYGHGHARRWGWLHADLGRGDVLEIVAAVSTRPGLRSLPAMSFVQLRRGGGAARDWPRDPLAAAPLLRGHIGLPDWSVSGTVGRSRLRVEVHLPPGECVALRYEDPDGQTATCTNSERADCDVVLERWRGRWRTEASWSLRRSAHAEVGLRP